MKLAWFVVLLLSMAAAEKTEQCLRTITCKDSWFMEYSCTCNSVYCECKADSVTTGGVIFIIAMIGLGVSCCFYCCNRRYHWVGGPGAPGTTTTYITTTVPAPMYAQQQQQQPPLLMQQPSVVYVHGPPPMSSSAVQLPVYASSSNYNGTMQYTEGSGFATVYPPLQAGSPSQLK